MTNSTSYIKHLSGNLTRFSAIILLIVSSLSAPLLASRTANADTPVAVCQDASINPSTTFGAPTLLTPSNSSTNPNGFDFSWTSVDGATQYDWESSLTADLNSDGSFVNRLGYHRLTTTSINEAGSPQATYYWHVRAVASDDTTSAWSQTWKSTISNAQASYLSAPALTFPSNGATCNIYDEDFYFSWEAPASDGGKNPLTYVFQSGQSANTDPATGNFTDQPWTNPNIATTSVFDGNSPDGTYYWHVRAVGNDGTLGPWSATWKVTIIHEAPVVTPPVDTPVPPVDTPVETPSDSTPVTSPAATPVATTTSSISTAIATSATSIFIPPSADIAAVLGTDVSTNNKEKASGNKDSRGANLSADVAGANDSHVTRNIAWVLAILLALTAAIFAFHRRSQSTDK